MYQGAVKYMSSYLTGDQTSLLLRFQTYNIKASITFIGLPIKFGCPYSGTDIAQKLKLFLIIH